MGCFNIYLHEFHVILYETYLLNAGSEEFLCSKSEYYSADL
jgi:hypothetical protein